MQQVTTVSFTNTLKTVRKFLSSSLSSTLKNTERLQIQIQIQILERIFRDTFTRPLNMYALWWNDNWISLIRKEWMNS